MSIGPPPAEALPALPLMTAMPLQMTTQKPITSTSPRTSRGPDSSQPPSPTSYHPSLVYRRISSESTNTASISDHPYAQASAGSPTEAQTVYALSGQTGMSVQARARRRSSRASSGPAPPVAFGDLPALPSNPSFRAPAPAPPTVASHASKPSQSSILSRPRAVSQAASQQSSPGLSSNSHYHSPQSTIAALPVVSGSPSSPEASTSRHQSSSTAPRGSSSKSVLTVALQKANSAVLLDQAQNFPAAIAAYTQSIKLLKEVMDRVEESAAAWKAKESERAQARSNAFSFESDDQKYERLKREERMEKREKARLEEARRLRVIHDTYLERVQALIVQTAESDLTVTGDDLPESPNSVGERYKDDFDPDYERQRLTGLPAASLGPPSHRSSQVTARQNRSSITTVTPRPIDAQGELRQPGSASFLSTASDSTASTPTQSQHSPMSERAEFDRYGDERNTSPPPAHTNLLPPARSSNYLAATSPARNGLNYTLDVAISGSPLIDQSVTTEYPKSAPPPIDLPAPPLLNYLRQGSSSNYSLRSVSGPAKYNPSVAAEHDESEKRSAKRVEEPQRPSNETLESKSLIDANPRRGTLAQRRKPVPVDSAIEMEGSSTQHIDGLPTPAIELDTGELNALPASSARLSGSSFASRQSVSVDGIKSKMSTTNLSSSVMPYDADMSREDTSRGTSPGLYSSNGDFSGTPITSIFPPSSLSPSSVFSAGPVPPMQGELFAAVSQQRRPFQILLRIQASLHSGCHITPSIFAPKAIWSQNGIKFAAMDTKTRSLQILLAGLEGLEKVGEPLLVARAVDNPGHAKQTSEKLARELDMFDSILDDVQNSLAKKLEFVENVKGKKGSGAFGALLPKISRSLDKISSAKSLDAQSTYFDSISKVAANVQILDAHICLLAGERQPSPYANVSSATRGTLHSRLKRASEFLEHVVVRFILRDIALLLDKYAKRMAIYALE